MCSRIAREFIKLTGGDPDVEAPQHVVATALDAIKKSSRWTNYASQEIHRRFQEAVVDYYKAFDLEYKPENVIPTAGSSAALFIARARVMHPQKIS